jgi:hypothetical protein
MPDTTFDMDKAVTDLGAELGFESDVIEDLPDGVDESLEEDNLDDETQVGADEPEVIAENTETIEDDFPKSWPKETKESWAAIPQAAKDQIKLREKQMLDGLDQYKNDANYGKSLKEALNPYQQVIRETGLNEAQAVQYLMNAHVSLTAGSKEQRMAAYQQLGRNLGLELPTQPTGEQPATDPKLREFESRVERMEREAQQRQIAEQNVIQEKTRLEVDKFATENPYFDEVAEDVAIYIKGGLQLKEAYERAIWANPVTRLKEQARIQTETEKSLKLKAAEEAKLAKKTRSSNINTRQTNKVPTEPKGKMFDDMEAQLAAIKNRH